MFVLMKTSSRRLHQDECLLGLHSAFSELGQNLGSHCIDVAGQTPGFSSRYLKISGRRGLLAVYIDSGGVLH